MRAVLAALLVAGCATGGSTGDSLADAIGTRIAQPARDCISPSLATDTRIIDSQTIVYRRGGTIYVNRLQSACPGLRPQATLVTEVLSGQLCRNDMVRAAYPNEAVPGPRCRLGEFTPYALPR